MQNNDAIQKKSLKNWWGKLTDYVWELFLANLCYLLCVLPAYACIVLFLLFNAWAFLMAGLVLILPVGPAMLALHSVAAQIAGGKLRTELTRFFAEYKHNWRRGLILSAALIVIGFVILFPPYFALVTNSAMKLPIFACATVATLLMTAILPYVCTMLISGEHGKLFAKVVTNTLRGGKKSFFAGLMYTAWFFVCLVFPYGAVFAMLIGLPAVVRLSVAFLLQDNPQEL